jgi:hypothetical protein
MIADTFNIKEKLRISPGVYFHHNNETTTLTKKSSDYWFGFGEGHDAGMRFHNILVKENVDIVPQLLITKTICDEPIHKLSNEYTQEISQETICEIEYPNFPNIMTFDVYGYPSVPTVEDVVEVMTEKDPNYPLGEFDATKWAPEFKKIGVKLGYLPETISDAPGDWLHTWFCSAIMTGYDHGCNLTNQANQEYDETELNRLADKEWENDLKILAYQELEEWENELLQDEYCFWGV